MTPANHRDALLREIENKPHLENRFMDMRRIGPEGGGGQFSLVLDALDKQTNKRVALKFFDPSQRNDQYRWESFKREAELLPTFQGRQDILQCVCPLAEFKEPFKSLMGVVLHIDFAYYAVELAAYDVNNAIINGRWTVENKLLYFRAMCRAVQRVHGASMAHRDLKPSNFLVMPDGALRLSDFGTARVIDSLDNAILSSYSNPPGDLRYTSPEMLALLHDVDPKFAYKGDFYALGAILFELFTGSQLNLLIFTFRMMSGLTTTMNAVPQAQRIRTFNGFVSSLASGHSLPNMDLFGADIPGCIGDLLDTLYKSLAALDHRDRLMDWRHIFMQIDRCVYVLRHEAAYRRWRERKRMRR